MTNIPNFTKIVKNHPNYREEFLIAYNYAKSFSNKQLKEQTEKWLNRSFSTIPDGAFRGIGEIAFIINNSGYVCLKTIEKVSKRVNTFSTTSKILLTINDEDSAPTKYKKNTTNMISELHNYLETAMLSRIQRKTLSEIINNPASVNLNDVISSFSNLSTSNTKSLKIIGQITNMLNARRIEENSKFSQNIS